MSFSYRDAGLADGPALAAMAGRCFVETHAAHFPAGDIALHVERAFGADGLPLQLGNPGLRVRLVEDDGEIAAYLKLGPMSLPVPHEPGAFEVEQLYVLKPWQGRGVAAALMDWAIATARAEGAPALYLSVWEHGARAIAFYSKCGFVRVGTAPFQLGTRSYQDPVMRLGL